MDELDTILIEHGQKDFRSNPSTMSAVAEARLKILEWVEKEIVPYKPPIHTLASENSDHYLSWDMGFDRCLFLIKDRIEKARHP